MPRFYHFSNGIKAKKSKSKITLVQKIHLLVDQLEKKAARGDEESEQDLHYFREQIMIDFHNIISQKVKSGEPYWQPVRSILQIADWAIPLLLWLTEHRLESVKKYARKRYTWPAYAHLLKREQSRYQKLLPKFNKTGTKIIEVSPIELGGNLPFQLNANLTKGDFIFRVAAHAISYLAPPYDSQDFLHDNSWLWLPKHHKPLLKLHKDDYSSEALKFLNSLGGFSRNNWHKWKPIFESYIAFKYGLPESKFELFPKEWQSNLDICFRHGAEMQWFEIYKETNKMSAAKIAECSADLRDKAKFYNASPPLQSIDQPEIREIINRKKTERGKWNELKDELLKRIYKLAPKS